MKIQMNSPLLLYITIPKVNRALDVLQQFQLHVTVCNLKANVEEILHPYYYLLAWHVLYIAKLRYPHPLINLLKGLLGHVAHKTKHCIYEQLLLSLRIHHCQPQAQQYLDHMEDSCTYILHVLPLTVLFLKKNLPFPKLIPFIFI